MKRYFRLMKKIFVLFTVLVVGIVFIVGCSGGDEGNGSDYAPTYHVRISASKARAIMDESPDSVLLDVRTLQEFSERRIEGAILLPHDQISLFTTNFIKDKATIVLVYCRTGIRSNLAALQLVSLGFRNVFDFGGINDWPFETVSG